MAKKKVKSLTLKQLIGIANDYYPDDMLLRVEEEGGDTLALFIVREITDTWDPCAPVDKQLEQAAHQMQVAKDELHELIDGLGNEVYLRSEKFKKLNTFMKKNPPKGE